jgi:hypothetical protein
MLLKDILGDVRACDAIVIKQAHIVSIFGRIVRKQEN